MSESKPNKNVSFKETDDCIESNTSLQPKPRLTFNEKTESINPNDINLFIYPGAKLKIDDTAEIFHVESQPKDTQDHSIVLIYEDPLLDKNPIIPRRIHTYFPVQESNPPAPELVTSEPVKNEMIDKVPLCSMNTYYCCCYCCVRRIVLGEPEHRLVDTIGSHVFSVGGWIHIGQLEYLPSYDQWIIEHDAPDPARTYCYPCCLLQILCCSIGYKLCGCARLCGEEEFPWVLPITD